MKFAHIFSRPSFFLSAYCGIGFLYGVHCSARTIERCRQSNAHLADTDAQYEVMLMALTWPVSFCYKLGEVEDNLITFFFFNKIMLFTESAVYGGKKLDELKQRLR